LPADLPLGPATLTLHFNEGLSSSAEVEIVPLDFALYTLGPGYGPALAQNIKVGEGIQPNGLTTPVHPGDFLTLWGTGLGTAPSAEVKVLLGGQPVPVVYAGPAPVYESLDQINVFVPEDAPILDDCYATLVVEIGDYRSNGTSVSKTGAGACSHPLTLTFDQMQLLDQGGRVPFGEIGVASYAGTSGATPQDWVRGLLQTEATRATFLNFDAAAIARLSRRQNETPTLGCTVNPNGRGATGVIYASGSVSIGSHLTLSGPEGKIAFLLPADPLLAGYYAQTLSSSGFAQDPSLLPAPYLAPGDWLIDAPGSPQVEGFRLRLQLPPHVQLANPGALRTVNRNADLTIEWNPNGFRASDILRITLSGASGVTAGPETAASPLTLTCSAPALDGRLTIPSAMLRDFAADGPNSLPGTLLSFFLNGPADDEEAIFAVPLVEGGVLPGRLSYSWGLWFPVTME
jgi:hypothetical protein